MDARRNTIRIERRQIMYCSACGKEIPEDSKYCLYCGKPLDTEKKENDEVILNSEDTNSQDVSESNEDVLNLRNEDLPTPSDDEVEAFTLFSKYRDTMIALALQNTLKDRCWQCFGYKKLPTRGKLFNRFVAKEKLAKETFLKREFAIASIGIALNIFNSEHNYSRLALAECAERVIICLFDINRKVMLDSLKFDSFLNAALYFNNNVVDYFDKERNFEVHFYEHAINQGFNTKETSFIMGTVTVCETILTDVVLNMTQIDVNTKE